MGLLSFLTAAIFAASVGEISFAEAVLAICGASDIEELEQDQVDHFRHLMEHPVHVNLDSRSRLLASGLFSAYQVASIFDSRKRNGDILSVTELSALDGFAASPVRAMALFLDFSTSSPAGTSSTGGSSYIDADARISYKTNDNAMSYGARARAEFASRTLIASSINHSYSDDKHNWTASLLRYGKEHLDKAVLGNFNLKTGQGLVLWTGMGFSGAGSPESLIRNATLLGGTNSFSGTSTLFGGGTEWNFSRHLLTAACALKDGRVLPVLNLTKINRSFQTGFTAFYNGDKLLLSADARACIRRTDVFCEFASCPSVIAGSRFNFSYGNTLALALRYYSPDYKNPFAGGLNAVSCTDERAATVAWKYRRGLFSGFTTADFCCFSKRNYSWQFKLISNCSFDISELLKLNARLSYRQRSETNGSRTDIRTDIIYDSQRFWIDARLNWLRCVGDAFLVFSEQGYKTDFMAIFLCEGAFHIDHWDDRIYAYQRDAPGSFSVPAYYGRGVWGSLFIRLSYKQTKLYLRASTLRYADKQAESVSKRYPKTELKVQLTTSLGF